MAHRHWLALYFIGCFWSAAGGLARGEVPRNNVPDKDTLQAVLDRIHTHAEGNAWQNAGFRDEAIEGWLDKLLAKVAAAAETPNLKLPVRLAEVSVPNGQVPQGLRDKTLTVGKNVNVSFLRNSIVWADGNVEVAHAENSVIVARGAASVSHARNCVIVSGIAVEVAHDGDGQAGTNASVMVTRGSVNLSFAWGTKIAAADGVTVSHAQNALFLNGPVPKGADRGGCKSIQIGDFGLGQLPQHPLAAQVKFIGFVQPKGIVFRFADKRYVADVAQPITDEAGAELPALKGWQVSFATNKLAVFSRADVDFAVRFDVP
jgi:hypothetical protein